MDPAPHRASLQWACCISGCCVPRYVLIFCGWVTVVSELTELFGKGAVSDASPACYRCVEAQGSSVAPERPAQHVLARSIGLQRGVPCFHAGEQCAPRAVPTHEQCFSTSTLAPLSSLTYISSPPPLAYRPAPRRGILKTSPGPFSAPLLFRTSVAIYLLHDPASTPMAHIASCLLDSDQDDLPAALPIAKAVSRQNSNESVCNTFKPALLAVGQS